MSKSSHRPSTSAPTLPSIGSSSNSFEAEREILKGNNLSIDSILVPDLLLHEHKNMTDFKEAKVNTEEEFHYSVDQASLVQSKHTRHPSSVASSSSSHKIIHHHYNYFIENNNSTALQPQHIRSPSNSRIDLQKKIIVNQLIQQNSTKEYPVDKKKTNSKTTSRVEKNVPFSVLQLHKQALQEMEKKRKRKRNAFKYVPDEVLLHIFQFLSVQDLVQSCSLVCRRFAVLWNQGVASVKVVGKLRKLKEDDFIRVLRRFVRLESLDVCNNGTSEDFQITDKGLLQIAHKYIYSNADYLNFQQQDPLHGEFDFAFDFETHMDSFETTEVTDFSDAENDSACGDLEENAEVASNVAVNSVTATVEDASVISETSSISDSSSLAAAYNVQYRYHHSCYYPLKNKSSHKRTESGEPQYGLHTLQSLNLLGCHGITENGVKYLTYICHNVKHLCLKGCTKLNDNAMSYIATFENLESLDVTGCTHISNNGMNLLTKLKSKQLKLLDVTFCHQITDAGVKLIAKIPTLTDVNLQCCSKVTAEGVYSLLSGLPKLKNLNVTGCSLVKLCAIPPLLSNLKLERLSLMGCKATCDECMKRLVEWTHNLSELVLAYSDHVTDKGITHLVRHNVHLNHLNLKRCVHISDKSLESISEFLSHSLNYLNLTGCKSFSNKAIGYLANLRELRHLYLRRCTQITNEGLAYLPLLPSIQSLDLSELTHITDEGVKTLLKNILQPDLIFTSKHTSTDVLVQLKRSNCLSVECITSLKSKYRDLVAFA